jgi:beta-lactamase class A
VSYSMVRRRTGRARSNGDRGPAAVPRNAVHGGSNRGARGKPSGNLRRSSVLAALVAYVLVGAFIGMATWKLTETAVETASAPAAVEPPREEPRVEAVAPPPAAPRGPHQDLTLSTLLERQPPASGFVGLFVRNLTTGAEASINPNRIFPAASLYKVPIMVETVRQIRLGRIAPDQQMVVQRAHKVPGSGVLQSRIGESVPIREVLRLLIAESDNVAAMMLLDLTGLNNVNQTMRGLGLGATKLLDYRAQGAYEGVGPYATSPADMGLLLDTIGTGRLVDQEASDEALKLLGQKQASDLISEALPFNVKVAHKWGEIPGARHEAGIVFTPQFNYVVVIMTESVDPVASPGYIRDISKSIYSYFEQTLTSSGQASRPAQAPQPAQASQPMQADEPTQ